MRASRILPPLLAGATLLLLGANALPTVARKHRLEAIRQDLVRRLQEERMHGARLQEEIRALESDPFCLQRAAIETWRQVPAGGIPWDPEGMQLAEE